MISFKEKGIFGASDSGMIVFTTPEDEFVLVSYTEKDKWAKASKMAMSFTKWDDYDKPIKELTKDELDIARYNLAHVEELIDVRPQTTFK